MTILRLAIGLWVLIFASSAHAENWQWIGLTTDRQPRFALYVDSESIRREGDIVEARYLGVMDEGAGLGFSQVQFDCRRRTETEIRTVFYDSQGNQTELETSKRREQVRSGTIEAAALGVVCGVNRALVESVADPIAHALTMMTGQSVQSEAGGEADATAEGISSGTGFFVGSSGQVLTAYHVIEGADEIAIRTAAGDNLTARVERVSPANDLAVLRVDTRPRAFLGLAPPGAARTGDRVFTLGYPVIQLLGVSEPRFSDGTVSALSGAQGEDSWMQISVPVQPGNSGGPLLNEAGQVVGIVTAQSRVATFLETTGTLPQNINWAVKAEYAAPLIGSQAAAPVRTRSEGIAVARNAVVVVVARRAAEAGE